MLAPPEARVHAAPRGEAARKVNDVEPDRQTGDRGRSWDGRIDRGRWVRGRAGEGRRRDPAGGTRRQDRAAGLRSLSPARPRVRRVRDVPSAARVARARARARAGQRRAEAGLLGRSVRGRARRRRGQRGSVSARGRDERNPGRRSGRRCLRAGKSHARVAHVHRPAAPGGDHDRCRPSIRHRRLLDSRRRPGGLGTCSIFLTCPEPAAARCCCRSKGGAGS